MDTKRIGRKLAALRGDTPAKKVGTECGVSFESILSYEAGERVPNDEVKRSLAEYYGVTVQELFYDDTEVQHEPS